MSKNSVTRQNEIVRLPVVQHRDKISYSEWQLFRSNCEWRWYVEYVQGHKIGDKSIALEFGTAMHGTMEKYLNPVVSERISLEQAVQDFRERIDVLTEKLTDEGYAEYGPWPEDEQDASPWGHKDSGERIIRYVSSVPELAESTIAKLEYELDDVLERTDTPIRYRGFIDLVLVLKDKRGNKILVIGDFKTCKWGWPYKKFSDPDVLAQVRLYKHFFCKKTGADPKPLRTMYFLMKKRPGPKDTEVIQAVRVSSSQRDIQNTIESMQTDITRMRGGVYERNRSSCVKPWGMCPHYNTERCPGKIEQ